MPKGTPYSGEFKEKVVEDMRTHKLGYRETAQKYGIPSHVPLLKWERIYLEEGPEGLYVERRGRANVTDGKRKGRPPRLDKRVEEDLITENQRLRAENDYLKKLHVLVMEEERRNKRRK